MKTVLKKRGDKAAIYIKPTSGDPEGPFTHPELHLDKVKFHADFDYYQLHSGPDSVVVSHPSVAALSTTFSYPNFNIQMLGRNTSVRHTLVNHNLGYIPAFLVVHGKVIVSASYMVQVEGVDRCRYVTPFATETQIGLFDCGISSQTALSAMATTYQVIVFRAPVASNKLILSWLHETGRLVMGKGKFDSARKMLRRAGADDSPFDLSLGPSIDIKNGSARFVRPDGSMQTEDGYNGSFAGPATLQCAVA